MHGIVTQLTRCSLLVAATAALVLGSPETLSAQRSAQPQTPYTATPEYAHFLSKARLGEPVTVAFLGGSVTVGATTRPRLDPLGNYDFTRYTRERDCWRAKVMRGLEGAVAQYPNQIRMVNAGLSGTGSLPGAFRYASDVGTHNPDMLIIEFAINDLPFTDLSLTPGADFSIQRSLISIVEQARMQNPNIAILMAISPTATIDSDPTSSAASSRIITRDTAIALGVPYVDVSADFYERPLPQGITHRDLYAGDLTRFGNGLHPSPIGHTLYAKSVIKTVIRIFRAKGFPFPQQQNPLPTTLTAFPQLPSILAPQQMPTPTGFRPSINLENWNVHPLFEGKAAMFVNDVRTEIRLNFQGSAAAVLWEWKFDGQQIHGKFDAWIDQAFLGTFSTEPNAFLGEQRLSRFQVLGEGLDPTATHRITIKIPREQPGFPSEPLNLALLGLYIEGN